MSEDRRYSDKEVEALLARAVELSRPTEGSAPRQSGTSLSELERIAAEAGLSPEALRRAAAELDSLRPASPSAFRRVVGAEKLDIDIPLHKAPDEAELGRLLLVLPDLADFVSGSGAIADGKLVWRSVKSAQSQSGIGLRIELGPKGGEGGGSLRIQAEVDGAAGGVYGGIMGGLGLGCGFGIGFGVGLGELHSAAFATLVPLVCLALSFPLSRLIVSSLSRWTKKRALRLADEIAKRLS